MALPIPERSGPSTLSPARRPAQPQLPPIFLQRLKGPAFQARSPFGPLEAGGGPNPQLSRPQPAMCSLAAKAPGRPLQPHKLPLIWNL